VKAAYAVKGKIGAGAGKKESTLTLGFVYRR
jgi:hypothetical protein